MANIPLHRPEAIMPFSSLSRIALLLISLSISLQPISARAWGYQGHEVVGSIAEQLLNPKALQQVREIMKFFKPPSAGPWTSLQIAGPWADCVRSVAHDVDGLEYVVDPAHPEYEVPCTPFRSPEARGPNGGLGQPI
jgi:hypothetical protein